MKTAHTEGKWHLRIGDADNHYEIIGDLGTNKTIALLPKRCFASKEEAEANAKLIASAPQLLNLADALWHALNNIMPYLPAKEQEKHRELLNYIQRTIKNALR